MVYFTCILFTVAFVINTIANINFLNKLNKLKLENEDCRKIIDVLRKRINDKDNHIEQLQSSLNKLSEAVQDTDNIRMLHNTTKVKELKLEKIFTPQQTSDMRKYKIPELAIAMNELKKSIPNELISYECHELENDGIRITVCLKIVEPLNIN